MSADQFELALQDQQLTDVTMTADACGITRDCFITVVEKPVNEVSLFFLESFYENFWNWTDFHSLT